MDKDTADERKYAAFLEGFEAGTKAAADIVQLARGGTIDQDFRSIIFRIEQLSPADIDE